MFFNIMRACTGLIVFILYVIDFKTLEIVFAWLTTTVVRYQPKKCIKNVKKSIDGLWHYVGYTRSKTKTVYY